MDKKLYEIIINNITCPISHQIMAQPVVACDGFVYEQEVIKKWFRNNDTSPLLGKKIKTITHPCQNISNIINIFLSLYPDLCEDQYIIRKKYKLHKNEISESIKNSEYKNLFYYYDFEMSKILTKKFIENCPVKIIEHIIDFSITESIDIIINILKIMSKIEKKELDNSIFKILNIIPHEYYSSDNLNKSLKFLFNNPVFMEESINYIIKNNIYTNDCIKILLQNKNTSAEVIIFLWQTNVNHNNNVMNSGNYYNFETEKLDDWNFPNLFFRFGASVKNESAVKYIIDNNINLHQTNDNLHSAVHSIACNENISNETMIYAMSKLDTKKTTKNGNTPFMFICYQGDVRLRVIKHMLLNGENLYQRNNEGRCAITRAIESENNKQLIKFIMEIYFARINHENDSVKISDMIEFLTLKLSNN